MKMTPTLATLAAAVCLVNPAIGQTVKVDGSSTVYPITAAVAEEFKSSTGIDVSIGVSGSGGGFSKFAAGETDISNASRQIKANEAKSANEAGIEFVEIPVAYDGLSVVVHPANSWADEITLDQIRKIFLDTSVKTWKDADPSWPNTTIKIYCPGEASGTYDYFAEVTQGKKDKSTGKHEYGEMRDDMSRSEDDHILVNGVAGDPGAIGYFGVAYYEESKDKLKALKVINGEGKAVGPTPSSIEDGSYEPFSRPLFIYANADSLKRPEVLSFVEFYLDEVPELCEEVGYVRLPSSVYAATKRNLLEGKTGSMYLDADYEIKSGSVVEMFK